MVLRMKVEVTMNERGTITIPAALRKSFGLNGHDRLIIEDTEEGLLLRPSVSVPIEIYTEDRIKEFSQDEQAIADLLPELEN